MTWATLLAQQAPVSAPSPTLLVTLVSALGAFAGVFAVYRGWTADKRQQRFVDVKANRDELDAARADVRRLEESSRKLEDGLRELRDREWKESRDRSIAQDRLLRVEQELADEKRKTAQLEARVKELEARGA